MTNLITEVKPDQLTVYGNLLVAFFDKELVKGKMKDKDGKESPLKVPTLYIHIQNSQDKHNILKKAAGKRRNQQGQVAEETELFARAYKKYLEIKENGGLIDGEKEALKARVAELEANALKKIEPKKLEPKKIETKAEPKKETLKLKESN